MNGGNFTNKILYLQKNPGKSFFMIVDLKVYSIQRRKNTKYHYRGLMKLFSDFSEKGRSRIDGEQSHYPDAMLSDI